jgi:catechol 2,3-dioxygenase-like lactoylglutathione lyase family enzyme
MSTIDDELVLTHFIVSDDVERSRRFYTDVLGGKTVISQEGDEEAGSPTSKPCTTSGPHGVPSS